MSYRPSEAAEVAADQKPLHLELIPYVRHIRTKLRQPRPPLTMVEGAGSSPPLASA